MVRCCLSYGSIMEAWYRSYFSRVGLKSATTDLGDGTVMHCWIPKTPKETNPNLVLIHGMGANAMWQWNKFVRPLIAHFNIYVPDLVFFGESYTALSDRSEAFQARCVMGVLDAHGVRTTNAVGISYGGFVAYSMAAQFPDRMEKLVLCCTGVCLEDKDMEDGMFQVKSVEEAVSVLLPQTPEKLKEMIRIAFFKPIRIGPSCLVNDLIDSLCTEYREQKKELIQALHKGRKFSNLPKITQPTLIMWGENDLVFPMELAHRLKSHIGDGAELVVIEKAGHALNVEKPREMKKLIQCFLVGAPPPSMAKRHHENGLKSE
ncbi:uncharacterized protein LOC111005247 [Momordica charantia]|uniref:Uncharacterized protein LOC111005247 n=1 Tax=Momordica charantia TaxID=3673 RepID=A0A6J1BTN3_MOMCH|nr:uncharacterized protein LOC111005247 [Momordica charantia]